QKGCGVVDDGRVRNADGLAAAVLQHRSNCPLAEQEIRVAMNLHLRHGIVQREGIPEGPRKARETLVGVAIENIVYLTEISSRVALYAELQLLGPGEAVRRVDAVGKTLGHLRLQRIVPGPAQRPRAIDTSQVGELRKRQQGPGYAERG